MSRGLGKVERELLDELNHTGMALVAPQNLDAELGRYWRFTLPSERNGAVTICASLMDEPKTY